MEAHLRKITRCLGRAVGELEVVSSSEKAAGEVSLPKNSSSYQSDHLALASLCPDTHALALLCWASHLRTVDSLLDIRPGVGRISLAAAAAARALAQQQCSICIDTTAAS